MNIYKYSDNIGYPLFHFRCRVYHIEYCLELELYELLDTAECKHKYHINHAYIGLRKLKHYRWPRLTKDKCKVRNKQNSNAIRMFHIYIYIY